MLVICNIQKESKKERKKRIEKMLESQSEDALVLASGKLRVSPRIERARIICQSPRKKLGKERILDAINQSINQYLFQQPKPIFQGIKADK